MFTLLLHPAFSLVRARASTGTPNTAPEPTDVSRIGVRSVCNSAFAPQTGFALELLCFSELLALDLQAAGFSARWVSIEERNIEEEKRTPPSAAPWLAEICCQRYSRPCVRSCQSWKTRHRRSGGGWMRAGSRCYQRQHQRQRYRTAGRPSYRRCACPRPHDGGDVSLRERGGGHRQPATQSNVEYRRQCERGATYGVVADAGLVRHTGAGGRVCFVGTPEACACTSAVELSGVVGLRELR